ncbi:hypothetical protein [Ponticaulis profundi]|uniref:Uncharacterized protein n=1 Tax=Ponticaulis profundi TaxID=2665222 RepID=A0ABW1SAZ8_9PROT
MSGTSRCRNDVLMFAFFDWMFGTLHIPERRSSRYGVPGESPHWTEEAFYPLNHLTPARKQSSEQA